MRLSPPFRKSGVVILFLFFALFFLPAGVSARDGDDNVYEQLKVFSDVLTLVQKEYVKEVESKKLIEGAIKGMISNLDPHSSYLDPDYFQDLQVQTKGEFGGLGLEVTSKDSMLVVVAPIEGAPASKAGILAGDAIVKIDGVIVKDFSLVDAVKRLRGPKGTAVTLTIFRKGFPELLDIPVIRDTIQVKSVVSRDLGDGYGYIKLTQFIEKSGDDLKAALSKLNSTYPETGLRGLILDMRNNPGGLLTEAVKISDLFLKEGVVVYTDGRVDNQRQKFFAYNDGREPLYPMVVLVNGGSASASEIVAGAFKEYGRALVVGTRTFGKGSVQTITPLENGGALSLTTALYYLKNGQSIQLTGIKPDVEVEDDAKLLNTLNQRQNRQSKPAELFHEGDLPGALQNPLTADQLKSDGSVPSGANVPPLGGLNAPGQPGGLKNEENSDDVPSIPSNVPTKLDVAPIDFESETVESIIKKDAQFAKGLELLRSFNVFE